MKHSDSFVADNHNGRPSHRALTGFLRKNWSPNVGRVLKRIVENCDVPSTFGQLPPHLRKQIVADDVPTVMRQFSVELDKFLAKKYKIFANKVQDQVYSLPAIGQLFNTECMVEVKGHNDKHGNPHWGGRPWSGTFSTVCKLSFPELGVAYALKLYNKSVISRELYGSLHTAYHEIAAAFGACRAEPRDNNPVYMACVSGNKYMMSQWLDKSPDAPLQRPNRFEIFRTSILEVSPRNWQAGRRMDYGATYLTPYGMLSYPVRKLYRKIVNAAEKNDVVAMQKIKDESTGYIAKQQFNQAIDCICDMSWGNRRSDLYDFVVSYKIHQK